MNKKPIVLFDIDNTLFDAEKFRRKIFQETIKATEHKSPYGLEKKIQDVYVASRRATGFFNPKLFIKDLIKELKIKTGSSVLEKLIFKEDIFLGNLYKETKQVLDLLSKNRLLTIGVFSTGHDSFQRKKIKEIQDLFHKEHIHIFIFKEKELQNIIKRYKEYRLYLIDDFLEILHRAKKLNKNVFTIWMKRGRFAKRQEPIPSFAPDATITSLKEVIKLVS